MRPQRVFRHIAILVIVWFGFFLSLTAQNSTDGLIQYILHEKPELIQSKRNPTFLRTDLPVLKCDSVISRFLGRNDQDAIITYHERAYYSYDANGRLIRSEGSRDIPGEEYKIKNEITYLHMGNKHQISTISSEYDNFQSKWIYTRKEEKSFLQTQSFNTYSSKSWLNIMTNWGTMRWRPMSIKEEGLSPNSNISYYSYWEWDNHTQTIHPVNYSKTVQDSLGKKIYTIYSRWDDTGKVLVPDSTAYHYNESDSLQLTTSYKWDLDARQYVQTYTVWYHYNNAGELLYHLSKRWDSNSLEWRSTDSSAYTYQYTPSYVEQVQSSYTWSNPVWKISSRRTTRTDHRGNEIYYVVEFIGSNGEPQDYSYMYKLSYNKNNQLTRDESYRYRNNAWVGSYAEEYGYDPSGNLIWYADMEWSGGQWVYSMFLKSTLDEYANTTQLFLGLWDPSENKWDSLLRADMLWTYFETPVILLPDVVTSVYDFLPENAPTYAILQSVIGYSWDEETDQWLKQGESIDMYYSSFLATAVRQVQLTDEISAFPNPCQDVLTITLPERLAQQSAQGMLYDFNGRQLLSFKFQEQTQLDLRDFPEGIYLLKVTVNGVPLKGQKVLKIGNGQPN